MSRRCVRPLRGDMCRSPAPGYAVCPAAARRGARCARALQALAIIIGPAAARVAMRAWRSVPLYVELYVHVRAPNWCMQVAGGQGHVHVHRLAHGAGGTAVPRGGRGSFRALHTSTVPQVQPLRVPGLRTTFSTADNTTPEPYDHTGRDTTLTGPSRQAAPVWLCAP